MKPTGDKCHIIVKTEKLVSISIGRINVKNKMEQKLLGIEFYLSLSFEGHMLSLCKKETCQNLYSLARIVNYMDHPKRKVLMKAFISSQFSCY